MALLAGKLLSLLWLSAFVHNELVSPSSYFASYSLSLLSFPSLFFLGLSVALCEIMALLAGRLLSLLWLSAFVHNEIVSPSSYFASYSLSLLFLPSLLFLGLSMAPLMVVYLQVSCLGIFHPSINTTSLPSSIEA